MKDKESIIGEYKYWEPDGVVIPRLHYEIDNVLQDREKFQLIYDDMEGINVEITFDLEQVCYYRWTDESDRLRTIGELIYRIKKDNKENGLIFELTNSEFERWFHEETFGRFTKEHIQENIRHFIFASDNDVVDVLAFEEPKVVVKTYKSE